MLKAASLEARRQGDREGTRRNAMAALRANPFMVVDVGFLAGLVRTFCGPRLRRFFRRATIAPRIPPEVRR